MVEILHQLRLVVFPITYKVSYIPDGERRISAINGTYLSNTSPFSTEPWLWEKPSILEILWHNKNLQRIFMNMGTWNGNPNGVTFDSFPLRHALKIPDIPPSRLLWWLQWVVLPKCLPEHMTNLGGDVF